MSVIQVVALAIIQGLAELLPVSSSAHVVVAEELMGLDPSAPRLTLLLVLLHTGTMCAVIVYFWKDWRRTYFASMEAFQRIALRIVIATALTGAVGWLLAKLVVRLYLRATPHAVVEDLFSHLELIAPALFAVGILIIVAYFLDRRVGKEKSLTVHQSVVIGIVQGLCLPFRGFSRSGATISAGMIVGIEKTAAEAFSFALAVVLTPAVVIREVLRLREHGGALTVQQMHTAVGLDILGGLLAFVAGLVALKWMSAWLERGRWYYFGGYCIVAAVAVELLHRAGF
ncbi:MAG: undecaprenyl-diphosphate phosphatase [Steroidobacteraceae bacterium]